MQELPQDSLDYRVVEHYHEVQSAPFAMCFTPSALAQVIRSVGAQPPETGAKGFGPKDRLGFDVVEFDQGGSARARGSVYAPDEAWGNRRLEHWLDQPDDQLRLWSGDIHSHPGRSGWPSQKAGQALGDLGYVEEVFKQNEAMQYFLLPILTGTGTGRPVEIHPWVVSRSDPVRPMTAQLKVCSAEGFPERVFNPAWESQQAAHAVPAINVARLEDLLGVRVVLAADEAGSTVLRVPGHQMMLELRLSAGFPESSPTLKVWVNGKTLPIAFRWQSHPTGKAPERRLAALCQSVATWMLQVF
jgi:hypothetical protein